MRTRKRKRWAAQVVVAAQVVAAALALAGCGGGAAGGGRAERAVPVEVAPVEVGSIELRRSLSGTLLASADFVVAPRVSGRIKELRARVADALAKDGVLAVLDDEPYQQDVKRAEADLLVARAKLTEAGAQAEIAERGMERYRQLSDGGFVSETQYDEALTQVLAAEAALQAAEAEVTRAEALLESARIQLQYTQVRASWTDADEVRYVAERYVDEGDMVGVNQRMFRVVDLDPLLATVYVTETDYPRVQAGDPVSVRTDAYPGRTFAGEVARIAPVFTETSRQAMVELHLENPEVLLKPGMFISADLILERREQVRIVPQLALVRRDNHDGLFVLDDAAGRVHWREVQTGIREGDRVEIVSPEITGRVVILGQQLLEEGTTVKVAGEDAGAR